MYIYLQSKMCRELEALEEKYRTGAEMSEGDLRRIDLLTHSMKSLATYIAMKEAEDYRTGQMAPAQNQMSGTMNGGMSNQAFAYAPSNQGNMGSGMHQAMQYPNNSSMASYADNSYAQRSMQRPGYPPYPQGEQRW